MSGGGPATYQPPRPSRCFLLGAPVVGPTTMPGPRTTDGDLGQEVACPRSRFGVPTPNKRTRTATARPEANAPGRLQLELGCEVKSEYRVVVDDLDGAGLGRVLELGRVHGLLAADHQELPRLGDLEAVLRLGERTVLRALEVLLVPREPRRAVAYGRGEGSVPPLAALGRSLEQGQLQVTDDVAAVRALQDEVRGDRDLGRTRDAVAPFEVGLTDQPGRVERRQQDVLVLPQEFGGGRVGEAVQQVGARERVALEALLHIAARHAEGAGRIEVVRRGHQTLQVVPVPVGRLGPMDRD